MQIVLKAAIRYANRYARPARIVAENFESDPKRRAELLRIAETCERVPAKPPRNLQEALQFDHFVQILDDMRRANLHGRTVRIMSTGPITTRT